MSTVSGGGYVGISLSASLEMTRGEFPFETDFPDENPVLQHLRNYSNYLFPHGAQDLLVNFAIYARGLVTNFLLIMPFLLVPAALTILWNPTVTDLRNNSVAGFPKTLFLVGLFICFALLWAIGRQMKWLRDWLWLRLPLGTRKTFEIKPGFGAPMAMGLMLLAVGFSAVCELQPKILAEMFGLKVAGGALAGLTDSLSSILLVIAPTVW
jgi:hypothetical protein